VAVGPANLELPVRGLRLQVPHDGGSAHDVDPTGRRSRGVLVEGGAAMRKFECGTVVDGCDGVVSGETDDDVLQAAAEHAASAHGMTDLPPELVEQVRAGIIDA
jgi:predicted small metal-binding protein